MRAREPDRSGSAEHDGVRIAYEVFGDGDPTLLFLPNAPIVHSLQWKAQVPYFARHARVVTFDGRGNGRSDRPGRPEDYTDDVMVEDAFRVMAATDTDRVVVVALCYAVTRACLMAVRRPDRILGILAISPGVDLVHEPPDEFDFESIPDTDEGWAKCTRHYWSRDYAGWSRFWAEQLFPEPHSTKHIEDLTGWQLDSDAETNLLREDARDTVETIEDASSLVTRVRCPMLLVSADLDACQGTGPAERMAELTGAPLVRFEGSGHVSPARHPVKVNLLIRDFIRSIADAENTGARSA